MAIVKKVIKFDLPIDGVKVKTIDDLFEHITAELVDHLKTGLLAKWLRPRDAELAEKIAQIIVADNSDRELMIAILDCFGFDTDEQIIDAIFVQNIEKNDVDSVIDVKEESKPQEPLITSRNTNRVVKRGVKFNLENPADRSRDYTNQIYIDCEFEGGEYNESEIDFSYSDFIGCKFFEKGCRYIKCTNAMFSGTLMSGEKSSVGSWGDAAYYHKTYELRIAKCDFSNSIFFDSRFNKVAISEVNFTNVIFNSSVKATFASVNLFKCNFYNSRFICSLRDKEAFDSRKILDHVEFKDCNMNSTYIISGIRDDFKFISCDCSYVNVLDRGSNDILFRDSNLSKSNLIIITSLRLEGAIDLTGAEIKLDEDGAILSKNCQLTIMDTKFNARAKQKFKKSFKNYANLIEASQIVEEELITSVTKLGGVIVAKL